MLRFAAATLAACLTLELLDPAARAHAQAAGSFRVVPIETPSPRSHAWAYAALASGAALVGTSFAFSRRADDAYAAYLATTDPVQIQVFYDRTVRNDHLAQASLLTGEVLIAAGLYLRFVRRPPAGRVSVSLLPARCVVSCRF